MSVIDKNMFEHLKVWCDRYEEMMPKYPNIMYVNSRDRSLTNATIRKLMYEVDKDDKWGEVKISLYSAESFYRNMRDYYSLIASLYSCIIKEDDSLEDVIRMIDASCGWIVLIVEELETLSDDCEKMEEIMQTLVAFGYNNPSIILVGDGDYEEVFAGCEYALREMRNGGSIVCYEQEKSPQREKILFETPDDQIEELIYYWNMVYQQLEQRLFHYEFFKELYKDTLEYILPRVGKEKVFRKDIRLFKSMGAMCREDEKELYGCKPWEYDAAQNILEGLLDAIINRDGDNDDFSGENVWIRVVVEEKPTLINGIECLEGFTCTPIKVGIDNLNYKMDELAAVIHDETYEGNRVATQYLMDNLLEKRSSSKQPDSME